MQLPIQLAISWPDRWPGALEPLGLSDLAGLTFAPILVSRYPAFAITVSAGRRGGTAPCVLNAADEVAVQAFLEGALELGRVPEVLSRVLDAHTPEPVESLVQLREWDSWARERARDAVMMREVRS
jgi:1-deoxy-D-xylulose-5-phosphate reductoisomerase